MGLRFEVCGQCRASCFSSQYCRRRWAPVLVKKHSVVPSLQGTSRPSNWTFQSSYSLHFVCSSPDVTPSPMAVIVKTVYSPSEGEESVLSHHSPFADSRSRRALVLFLLVTESYGVSQRIGPLRASSLALGRLLSTLRQISKPWRLRQGTDMDADSPAEMIAR